MHAEIYKFFNDIDHMYDPQKLKESHFTGDPVPYTIIDNFLPREIFETIVAEIDDISEDIWTVFENTTSSRKEARNFVTAPHIQTLSNSMQSASFLKWIEELTNVEKLIPDPYLRGGGITRVTTGNRLGLHTDFNWNEQLRLTRRVNLIIYLNPTWQEDWGGELEFWDFDRTKCITTIFPKPNRLAIWNYDNRLLHGHPNPLTCPLEVARQNLIQFYYNSNATHETPPHRSTFNG
jgi:Rps23 Pro-64 3,4-dihydroxylase Tpa1-like proline 4-hydroxylase